MRHLASCKAAAMDSRRAPTTKAAKAAKAKQRREYHQQFEQSTDEKRK